MVDSNDRERIQEAQDELQKMVRKQLRHSQKVFNPDSEASIRAFKLRKGVEIFLGLHIICCVADRSRIRMFLGLLDPDPLV